MTDLPPLIAAQPSEVAPTASPPDVPLPTPLPETIVPTTPPESPIQPDAAPIYFGVEWNGSAYVAVAALLVAIGSLLVAAWSACYARKSYKIAKAQEDRRAAKIDPKLVKSASWASSDKKAMWVGTLLIIENPSDRDGSISLAELVINSKEGTLRVGHQPSSDGGGFIGETPRLLANSAIKGWLTFLVPIDFYSKRRINTIHVELSDPRGITVHYSISIPVQVNSDPTQI
ncbi:MULTISPECIES: hypothetical protein [unclassified Rhodococcus (in: high G+C Gram-positive bacteria)]|uniref:hypothetical protein n=1 Tax=unclassified Rhodococcus (in: high G+C Gram-positive bacteria) TaxID=192944 RepID=UPI0005E7FA4D|nr:MULTISPECIES: hypothetical protein [unclassified Rhodococcus (in: high G+C Gram-positive bacteria)]KJF25095.1 hypothetical protein SZ00_02021 [Rhodococcus sp. AD45]